MKKKKRNESNNKILSNAYFSSGLPGSYGGVKSLQRVTRKKNNVVKNWLTFQDTYTLHKQIKRKFRR